MTRPTTRTVAALLVAGGLAAFGAAAGGPHPAAAQEPYTEAQLESFADAAM